MKTEIFDFPVSDMLKEKVDRLLNESFGIGSGASLRRIQESKNTHYSNPVKYILTFDEESLVGIQMIFLRKIIFENKDILIGGLGGLCVDTRYRGRGIATELLGEAMEVLKELDCDIGMLFTNIKNPRYIKLYGKFGFAVLERRYSFIDKMGEIRTDHSAMIAPVHSKEKFDLILNSEKMLHLGEGEW